MFKKVIALSIKLYVILYLVVVLALVIYQVFQYPDGLIMALITTPSTVFFVGVIGVIPVLGGSGTLFIIPFAPFIITSLILMTISSVIENLGFGEKVNNSLSWKKILIVIALLIVLSSAFQIASYAKVAWDNFQYKSKYGISEKVTSAQKFIYFTQTNDANANILTVSSIDGSGKRELKKIPNKSNEMSFLFPSPLGHYYIQKMNPNSNGAIVIDLNGKQMLSFDAGIGYSDILKWSPDEKYIARMEYWGEFPDRTKNLVVYDIQNAEKYRITTLTTKECYGDSACEESFDWAEDSTGIYFNDAKGIHIASDINSVAVGGVKEKLLENIKPCGEVTFLNGSIICVVNGFEAGIKIEDAKNFNVEGKEYFVISQTIDQKTPKEFHVINKAPIDDVKNIYTIDDNYIILTQKSGPNVILNLINGTQKESGSGMSKQDIFLEVHNNQVGEAPARYVGD